MLSTCEEHTGLSRALSQLADVEVYCVLIIFCLYSYNTNYFFQEKIELLRSEQANSDLYILSETLKDYIGLFGAIKDVFHERVKVGVIIIKIEMFYFKELIFRYFKTGNMRNCS